MAKNHFDIAKISIKIDEAISKDQWDELDRLMDEVELIPIDGVSKNWRYFIADFYFRLGNLCDYREEALPFYRWALRIYLNTEPDWFSSSDREAYLQGAKVLTKVGAIYQETLSEKTAIPVFELSLKVLEKFYERRRPTKEFYLICIENLKNLIDISYRIQDSQTYIENRIKFIKFYHEISEFKNAVILRAKIFNYDAALQYEEGDVEEALATLIKCREFEKGSDLLHQENANNDASLTVSRTLSLLGKIHEEKGEYQKAKHYYKEAEKCFADVLWEENINDETRFEYAMLAYNLGRMSAKSYINEGLRYLHICIEAFNEPYHYWENAWKVTAARTYLKARLLESDLYVKKNNYWNGAFSLKSYVDSYIEFSKRGCLEDRETPVDGEELPSPKEILERMADLYLKGIDLMLSAKSYYKAQWMVLEFVEALRSFIKRDPDIVDKELLQKVNDKAKEIAAYSDGY